VKAHENVLPGGPGVPGEQGFGGQDFSGIAKAAAFHPGFQKPQNDVLVFVGLRKPFYGDYLAAPDFKSRDKAGFYDQSVKNYRTASAVPRITPGFGLQKLECAPEYINKPAFRVGTDYHVFAVKNESYGHGKLRFQRFMILPF
jgi:hypothetical protein